jgi:hypothetical protein
MVEYGMVARVFSGLGVDRLDEAFAEVCEGCSLQATCTEKCNALAAIGAMAVDATTSKLAANVFFEKFHKAISDIKR